MIHSAQILIQVVRATPQQAQQLNNIRCGLQNAVAVQFLGESSVFAYSPGSARLRLYQQREAPKQASRALRQAIGEGNMRVA